MIHQDEITYYQDLLELDEDQDAIDEFVEVFIISVALVYQRRMRLYLGQALEQELSLVALNKLLTKVSTATIKATTELLKNFERFLLVYADWTFNKFGIDAPKLKRAILQATLEQFKVLTEGAMMRTNQQVLSNIRMMQKEIIVSNQKFRRLKYTGKRLDLEVANFRRGLRKLHPEYFQAMEDGKVLAYSNGRRVTLNQYADMSVRATLLNVDRTAVEVDAEIRGVEVLEYYLRDRRTLKTGNERKICKDVLSRKIGGKSLVAMNEQAANKFGIMTLQEAKSQGAMGVWCRHSVRAVSKNFMKKLKAA